MYLASIYFTIVSGLFSILVVSAQFIPQNSKSTFEFQNEVLLSDLRSTPYRSGYRISSELTVSSVWSNDIQQLYHFELNTLKLETKSGDTRKDLKYKKRISSLDKIKKQDFYALFEVGKVVKFLTNNDEDISILNLERGIVSLFQFDMNQNPNHEHDISGHCTVFYKAKSSTKYKRTKTDCSNWSLIVNKRKEIPLGISIGSLHETEHELTQDGALNKLVSVEVHNIGVEAKPDVGNHIQSTMILKHLSSNPVDQLKGADEEQLLSQLKGYKQLSLDADVDGAIELFTAGLKQGIKNAKAKLQNDKIGTSELALTISNLVPVTRITHKEDLVKILKTQTAQDIKYQLIDLLAAAQTEDAHAAVTEIWKFDNEEHFSYLERYLQSLSIGTRPKEEIIQDLYGKVSFTQWKSDKLKDTTIQTLCALVSKYASIAPDEYNHSLLEDVKKLLLLQLAKCEANECRVMYIRGFENLKDPSTISILMKLVKESTKAVSVAAMKALKAFPVKHFSISEKKDFEKIFYQTTKKYDSSTRILALDILLELDNDGKQLVELLKYLTSSDTAFEVKTYLLQKIQMLCIKCPRFAGLVYKVLEDNPDIRNYHVVAQKGLTTALERSLSVSPAFNESLLSIQETSSGVLKMGIVDILLKSGQQETSIFKLGLYTSGLAAFVGGSKDNDAEETEEEPITAGMQIAVQGINFRPLVFFDGQSELMAHVWSGTASEPTPAYQATTLLQDHEEFLILQNGITIYFRFLGAKSIDLNGQIQTSLWNRNAHVEINQNTGIGLTGLFVARSSYVTLQNDFVVATEPKIGLVADIDFYSDLMLCLQLTRPGFKLWHQINKTLSIEETKYSSKNSVNATYSIPGNTLALNRKNNQMCNKIFS